MIHKTDLEVDDMLALRYFVASNRLDIVKIIVNQLPNILNKSSDDEDSATASSLNDFLLS